MFYSELEGAANSLSLAPAQSFSERLNKGFKWATEPEEVLVGLTAPALGVAPAYDDLKRKVTEWEGVRAANSLGLRSAVLMRDGVLTGEAGLAQWQASR
jgi:hypothetical protein